MRHTSWILLGLLSVIFKMGCFGIFTEEEDAGPDGGDDVEAYAELAPGAVAVSESDAADFVVTETTITVPASSALASEMAPGAVLVGGSIENPMLHRVLSATTESDTVVATVEPAALTDAFAELQVAFSTMETTRAVPPAKGITIYAHEKKSFPWSASLNKSFEATAGVTAGLEGQFQFTPYAEVLIDIRNSSLQELKFVVEGSYDTTLKEYFQVTDSVSEEYTAPLMPRTLLCVFVVPLGPIPLFIRVYGSIDGGLALSLDAGFTATFGQRTSGTLRMGFAYQSSSWGLISSDPLSFEPIPPALEMYTRAEIKPFIAPRMDVLFYIAGPYLALQSYGKLNLQATAGFDPDQGLSLCGMASISAGISGSAGGSVKVLGHGREIGGQLFDFSRELWSDVTDTDECDTDSDSDTDYPYRDAWWTESTYEIVAQGADLNERSSVEMAVTIGEVTERTAPSTVAASAVWNEVLARGRPAAIARRWQIAVQGKPACEVDVTREMIERWGGVTIDSCGPLSNLAFHINPIH